MLPADLTRMLVFPSEELAAAHARIKQLHDEKAALRKRKRRCGRARRAAPEQAGKGEKLRELDARARDVQLLKFGQVIDLERIESVGVNKAAEELREKIKGGEGAGGGIGLAREGQGRQAQPQGGDREVDRALNKVALRAPAHAREAACRWSRV